jgi:probable rRNA maturation factor
MSTTRTRLSGPGAAAAAARLGLSVQLGRRCALPVPRARLRRWVLAALEREARFTIRFVGADEGRVLNRDYRGKDCATNVLTFGYDEPRLATRPADAPLEADIVICLPVVRREARAQRKRLDAHLAHLVIHGVLHAQGWGHDDDDEARRMEALEARLLRRFRVADPYAPAPGA